MIRGERDGNRDFEKPTTIQAAGQPPKLIEEFIGRVNSGYHGGEHRPDEKSLGLVGTGANARVRRVHGSSSGKPARQAEGP